jgi:molybdopterin converting factor small subunit
MNPISDKKLSASDLSPAASTPPEAATWALRSLKPKPEEEWDRMRRFLGLGQEDLNAMLETVETLLRRSYELVVGNYDYLLQNPETAAILGWDSGPDPEHLAERRRFFTVWLGRTLGMDLGYDFARYLFRAGQLHAGHGPHQCRVPEVFVTGAVSLVNATFARFLAQDMPTAPAVPAALAGWNKALSMHLHMMLMGYQAAVELDSGDFRLRVTFYGRMRTLLERDELILTAAHGAQVESALRKLFNYYPHARQEVFDLTWEEGERLDAKGNAWVEVQPVYRPKRGWRLLINGRDIAYGGGLEQVMQEGDEMQVFPPGR